MIIDEDEGWRPIPGWEERYEIHQSSIIRRSDTKQIINETKVGAGYKAVRFNNSPKKARFYVHHLVMQVFGKERPSPKHERDHKDRNKEHNWISNLRWLTHQENTMNRANTSDQSSKLNWKEVREIRSQLATNKVQRRIAEDFKISPQTITLIKQRRIWIEHIYT